MKRSQRQAERTLVAAEVTLNENDLVDVASFYEQPSGDERGRHAAILALEVAHDGFSHKAAQDLENIIIQAVHISGSGASLQGVSPGCSSNSQGNTWKGRRTRRLAVIVD